MYDNLYMNIISNTIYNNKYYYQHIDKLSTMKRRPQPTTNRLDEESQQQQPIIRQKRLDNKLKYQKKQDRLIDEDLANINIAKVGSSANRRHKRLLQEQDHHLDSERAHRAKTKQLSKPISKVKNSKQKRILYKKIKIFPSQLFIICLISTLITSLSNILPNNLLVISWLLQLFDCILVVFVIGLANVTIQEQKTSYIRSRDRTTLHNDSEHISFNRVRHYGRSYLYVYYFIYKYISILNNNTKYLYNQQRGHYYSQTGTDLIHQHTELQENYLYRNPLLQHFYALIYYCIYTYSTALTELNQILFLCMGAIFAVFFAMGAIHQILFIDLQVFTIFYYFVAAYVYRLYSRKQEQHELTLHQLISKYILNRNVHRYVQDQEKTSSNRLHKSHFVQTLIKSLNKMVGLSTQQSSITEHANQFQRSLLFLTFSMYLVLYSCTRQCWNHLHVVILWIGCSIVGAGRHQSREFLKHRYKLFMFAYLANFILHYFYLYLFVNQQQNQTATSTCYSVEQTMHFHVTQLICIILAITYVILQQQICLKDNNLLQQILKALLLGIVSQTQPPNSTYSKDIIYKSSILLIKYTLICMAFLECILTYNTYSYKYQYYISQVSDYTHTKHIHNFTDYNKYSLYVSDGFGYLLLTLSGFLGFIYSRIVDFPKLYATKPHLISNYGYSSAFNRLVDITVLFYVCVCLIYSALHLTQIFVPDSINLSKIVPFQCKKIQKYNKLWFGMGGCQKLMETYSIRYQTLVFILCLLLVFYLCNKYAFNKRTVHQKQSYKSYINFIIILFWLIVAYLYVLILLAIWMWECINSAYLWICYLIAICLYTNRYSLFIHDQNMLKTL